MCFARDPVHYLRCSAPLKQTSEVVRRCVRSCSLLTVRGAVVILTTIPARGSDASWKLDRDPQEL